MNVTNQIISFGIIISLVGIIFFIGSWFTINEPQLIAFRVTGFILSVIGVIVIRFSVSA